MRVTALICVLAFTLPALSSCEMSVGDPVVGQDMQYVFDFNRQTTSWYNGTSDYGVETRPTDVVVQVQPLPLPLSGYGLFASARNNSDDLFVYIKRKVTGLQPLTTYLLYFELQIASNVADGCVGVGGSPGNSVYLKAGASTTEPVTALVNGEYVLQNLTKGNQANGGENALVLGDIANSSTDCNRNIYEYKFLSSQQGLEVTTDADGAVWLMFGTDSGFESTTSIYYRYAKVTAVLR